MTTPGMGDPTFPLASVDFLPPPAIKVGIMIHNGYKLPISVNIKLNEMGSLFPIKVGLYGNHTYERKFSETNLYLYLRPPPFLHGVEEYIGGKLMCHVVI